MPVLTCEIPIEAWRRELAERNGTAARPAAATTGRAESWNAWVQKIYLLEQLRDDWDGYGAFAPSLELIESAAGLARLLCEKGVEPPQAVVPGTDGAICIEWQDGKGTYAEIELTQPFHAEVMLIEPGQPARFWNLPTK